MDWRFIKAFMLALLIMPSHPHDHVSHYKVLTYAGVIVQSQGPLYYVAGNSTLDLVFSLYPTKTGGNCSTDLLDIIKESVTEDLTVLNETLKELLNSTMNHMFEKDYFTGTSSSTRSKRFAGVILGAAALALGGAAMITAGVAIHKVNQLEGKVDKILSAMKDSVDVIQDLNAIVGNLINIVTDLSDYTNEILVSEMDNAKCERRQLQSLVLYKMYLTKFYTLTQDMYRTPLQFPIPYTLLGEGTIKIIKDYWSTLPESELMSGRVKNELLSGLQGTLVKALPDEGILYISLQIPRITIVDDSEIYRTASVSIKMESGYSYLSDLPGLVVYHGGELYELPESSCVTNHPPYICHPVPLNIVPTNTRECIIQGNSSLCPFTTTPRNSFKAWTTLGETTIINCYDFECMCHLPNGDIMHAHHPLYVLDDQQCVAFHVDGIILRDSEGTLNITVYHQQIDLPDDHLSLLPKLGTSARLRELKNQTDVLNEEIIAIRAKLEEAGHINIQTDVSIWLIVITVVVFLLLILIIICQCKSKKSTQAPVVNMMYPQIQQHRPVSRQPVKRETIVSMEDFSGSAGYTHLAGPTRMPSRRLGDLFRANME
ncbi:fusion protein [Wenzhou pacific spadenose shark paramyxovirus]|uniref:Fusion glycoprotein F0 n=1 Tax=Wenzhou pacific spadenose shark paramyxovirus TaxID=2116452 RepID=A0A2P1GN10_9MONO|nr:fusion protein [Wenzhou pacific spadenose shark paramyxovirus]AVM87354.1 fusion protein [Wenzhou pacific spadenose shark paramyxovirus]